ncbi:PKD domain-containing protein [Lacihabitans sp. LS3-19]|uniref:PKD domain-containing protein n=1 Tax=Lacihabitans sp. LS3-19 TaxID=2487335 RepID=UPI0020CD2B7C|nr:PKD domain-containing protein [Lacihabitans sp. LS3-19]
MGNTDSLKNHCITVVAKGGSGKYKIDWGDNQTQVEDIVGEKQFFHEYNVKDFLNSCTPLKEIEVGARNEIDATDNVKYDIFFGRSPNPVPVVKQACEGQPIVFDNKSCPEGTGVTYKWEFNDGRTSTNKVPNFSFTDPNVSYSGKLTVITQYCASDTKPFNFSLEKKPKPKMSFSGFTIANTDTVFCQENGAIISLDATSSLNSTSYSWSITGGNYSVVSGNVSSGTVKIKFDESKTYKVTLVAKNSCGNVSAAPCFHRVVAKPSFGIDNQPDQCLPFDYKIPNPKNGASYTLNGSSFGFAEVKNLGVNANPYIVKGEFKYECGTISYADTFFVKTLENAKFLNLKDTVLCVGTNQILINASPAGGNWLGNNLIKNGSSATFDPLNTGLFEIKYQVGTGNCATETKANVDVKGVNIVASDVSVCEGQSNLVLQASPIGGIWSSPGCNTCIFGDTLKVSSLTNSSQDLFYEVSSNVGGATCQSSKKVTISKGNPKAEFTLSGGCVGQNAQILNSSSGASDYEWYLNGSSTVISTLKNPANIVLPAGNVSLKLIAKSGQCKTQKTENVLIGTPPDNFDITLDKISGCSPLPITLSSSAALRNDVDYEWDFGNGQTSTSYSPGIQMFQNQTYGNKTFTISLKTKNSCDTKIATKTLEVFPLVKSQIGVDSTVYRCGPASVKLSDRSLGKVGTSLWDFGDGSNAPSILDTLTHVFSAGLDTKVFTISLIAQNGCGSDTSYQDITVFPEKVIPFFTMDKIEACVGEIVKFKDATTPLPINWNWKVDGKLFALTDSTQYVFSAPKDDYLITMIAKTSCGSDSLNRKIKVKPPPDINFEILKSKVCEGEKVMLENKSPNASSFVWDYGENGVLDSLNYSTEFIYQSAGTKKVKLTVFGSTKECKNSLEKSLDIRPKPKVDFTLASDTTFFCETEFFKLVSNATNSNLYSWFADGKNIGAGKELEAKLAYGSYDIKLIVSNDDGCVDSLSKVNYLNINACEFKLPEVFTPNGDGIGDYFTIYATDGIENILSLRIRDRWGEIVFDKKDFKPNLITEGWDGTYKNMALPSGIYTYELKLGKTGGQELKEKSVGSFTLLR